MNILKICYNESYIGILKNGIGDIMAKKLIHFVHDSMIQIMNLSIDNPNILPVDKFLEIITLFANYFEIGGEHLTISRFAEFVSRTT
jgi:hypothetical protein